MRAARPRCLKAAVAQIATTPGDLQANFRKHLDMIAAARSASVDVLLFPELSLSGHSPKENLLEIALHRDDPMLAELADATGDMYVVAGFVEESEGAQFYNAAAAMRSGRVEHVHRKINLATYGRLEDGKHFGSGQIVDTFQLAPSWRAGILICADMWNPALAYLAAIGGATILLGPISSGLEAVGTEFDNPGGWDINTRFNALTYGMPVLIANRVGIEDGLTFWGGSRIVDPFGSPLAIATGMTEQLVTAELDYDVLRKARYLLPTVRDSNRALVHREIDRLHAREGQVDGKSS
ncbi:MAG TPA: nitrilase-related carbon-nitrogen hydrolase [Acidiphilium sp.]